MVDEERKQEWIRKTIEQQGRFLTKHRCDKCGGVGLGMSSPLDLSFLCVECMANALFDKPKLDLDDFAKL